MKIKIIVVTTWKNRTKIYNIIYFKNLFSCFKPNTLNAIAQLAGVVEYTDCTSAEG